jgi:hypothetical protein
MEGSLRSSLSSVSHKRPTVVPKTSANFMTTMKIYHSVMCLTRLDDSIGKNSGDILMLSVFKPYDFGDMLKY